MSETVNPISLKESNIIIEALLPWLKQFNSTIEVEELSSSQPSLALFRRPTSKIYDFDVIGGYSADFHFNLVYKTEHGDSTTAVQATQVLMDIVQHFDDAPPALTAQDSVINMVANTNPTMTESKEGWDTFTVECVLSYRHRRF